MSKSLDELKSNIEEMEKQLAEAKKEYREMRTAGLRDAIEARKVAEVLTAYKEHLESGQSARSVQMDDKDKEHVADLMLLTNKPVMYVCNVDEGSVQSGNKYVERVKAEVSNENAAILLIAASTEADIAELESYEERQMFLEDMGLDEPGVNKLIKSAYSLLNLKTYFTAGVKEVRAWTIKDGMKAPQAAGVIHTDFETGFIRAEVIKYDDYVELGSEVACKEAGKMSVEGKDYVVADGDVMHFRFNT